MTFLDRLLGPQCTCGQRVYPKDQAAHALDHSDGPATHARLLDGTTLCPAGATNPDAATPFLDVVTCPTCSGRLARIQGRPATYPEPRPPRRRDHRCGDTTCHEDHR